MLAPRVTDPHIGALVDRVRSWLSGETASQGEGRYRMTADGRLISADPAMALATALPITDAYLETDSILGLVNATRDNALLLRHQASTMAPRQAAELRRGAHALLRKSFRLALLAQDRPGLIKSCRLLAAGLDPPHGNRLLARADALERGLRAAGRWRRRRR